MIEQLVMAGQETDEQNEDERGLLDLMIARIPGLSSRERIKIAGAFSGEEDFLSVSAGDIAGLIQRPLRHSWRVEDIHEAAFRDRLVALRTGIRWVNYYGVLYPPLLREIFDPPLLLFYRGVLPDPEKPLAAVVGTRHPGAHALMQAFDIARGLGAAGIPVISGLALGIDAAAHRGNLEAGAPTIAVLGSGIDMVYPVSNRSLARRILETGGALLSEYPPGTGAQRWNFPARNRIISALARGVVVVEAPASSGALITAGFALDQGRDLWVASSGAAQPLGPDTGAGTRRLVSEGARIINNAEEILSEWNWETMSLPENEKTQTGAGGELAASLARTLGLDIGL